MHASAMRAGDTPKGPKSADSAKTVESQDNVNSAHRVDNVNSEQCRQRQQCRKPIVTSMATVPTMSILRSFNGCPGTLFTVPTV